MSFIKDSSFSTSSISFISSRFFNSFSIFVKLSFLSFKIFIFDKTIFDFFESFQKFGSNVLFSNFSNSFSILDMSKGLTNAF